VKKGHYWKRSAATSLALMVLLSRISSVSILLYPDNNNQAEAVIGFDGPKNLSTNSGSSLDPSVLAPGNNVYHLW
jgi:hypothetical protein